MNVLRAARIWVERGYWVYPVNLTIGEDGKKRVDFPGNWRDSTNDPDKLEALFGDATGIVVDTGKSGVALIDIDTAGSKDGVRNLRDAGISLPVTPMTATTWSGGKHGFFRQPEVPVGSYQNRPVRDVDVRGTGGVAFVWPTAVLRDDGSEAGRYTTASVRAVESLPVLPEGYAARIRSVPIAAKPEARKAPRRMTSLRDDQRDLLERFVQQDLDTVRQARDGARNEALGAATLLLADRYRKLGFGYEDLEADVLAAYEESGGTDTLQAKDWCRSGWTKSLREPLDIPRTHIDEMADQKHARMVADRIARARVTGSTARMVDHTSFVDWTQEPPDPEFWVQGVVPKGEQVVLYGRPEAGKTFTALDWAMSVALGKDWFGRPTTQGRVWFMAGEGNTRITARMHAWIEYHGATPTSDQLRLLNHVPDLMSDSVMDQLARKVADDEVDLVFIDTLGRGMAIGGGDISSPPDAAQALRSLQTIGKYRTTVTPVAIHHPIKDGGMAGAYNLLAGVDVALYAEVDTAGTGVLRFEKNKDGEKITVCAYRWRQSGASAVLVPAGQAHRAIDDADPYDRELVDYWDPLDIRRDYEERTWD